MKKIVCNLCGHTIKMTNDIPKEDFLAVRKDWGYFSSHDGETHSFFLCENCYERVIKHFSIPIKVTETKELL